MLTSGGTPASDEARAADRERQAALWVESDGRPAEPIRFGMPPLSLATLARTEARPMPNDPASIVLAHLVARADALRACFPDPTTFVPFWLGLSFHPGPRGAPRAHASEHLGPTINACVVAVGDTIPAPGSSANVWGSITIGP